MLGQAEYWTRGARSPIVSFTAMRAASDPDGFTAKPGAWGELALTLPVFLVYQLGVVFLNVRNATDLVTTRLLELAHGDRLIYLGLTASIGLVMSAVFAVLGRGQSLRGRKVLQIIIEGAAYAIAMGAATSWVVGKLFAPIALRALGPDTALASSRWMFAGPPSSAMADSGPFTGLVMSLGAGFYEELAFRAVLFGLGAKVLVWLFARQKVGLVGSAPRLSVTAIAVMVVWALVCAAAFSWMHYVGSLADPFDAKSFVARMVLGLMLTLVYSMRGFAAAVWTHALYDVWVLVL
ncbi:MAG TPA: CPBP family glutamic-type intramembrane protease [Polyangiaceae bacterium]|jgi:membrane protease YdiL (CAAX protease family)